MSPTINRRDSQNIIAALVRITTGDEDAADVLYDLLIGEREACASLSERFAEIADMSDLDPWDHIAAAIRNRSK